MPVNAGKVVATSKLDDSERGFLLAAARTALEAAVRRTPMAHGAAPVPPRLLEPGASFVTLTIAGNLRGCIGSLEAKQPLIDDVREHAVAAALEDFRFPPVQPDELAGIELEISRLTTPCPLAYSDADDLISKLRPHVHGVVIRDSIRRATFLPQVWAKIPDPADFLDNLCYKMGAPFDYWRTQRLEVLVYEVEEFSERRRSVTSAAALSSGSGEPIPRGAPGREPPNPNPIVDAK